MKQIESEQRGGGRGVAEERKGGDQSTCMNDPWTGSTVWGLTVGAGGGVGRGEQKGKNWGMCNRITIKMI